jgi:mannosyltransferase PIG-V
MSVSVTTEETKNDGGVRLRDGLRFCVVVFLVARIMLSALGVLGVGSLPPDPEAGGAKGAGIEQPATSGWHNAWDGTNRWDAAWYLRIADEGYRTGDASAAFYPAYPTAIRLAAPLTGGNFLLAALLVSNLAFLGALVVLFALTTDEFSRPIAEKTILLVTFFPSSFFFLAPYSESVYLLLTVLAFRWARRDRWGGAAIGGAAAAATRSVGMVLCPSLLVEAFDQKKSTGRSVLPRVAAATAVLIGPLLYAIYWAVQGSASAPIDAQSFWYRELRIPIVTLADALALGLRGLGSSRGLYWTADLLLTGAFIIPLLIGWRRLRPSYLAYVVIGMLVPLTYPLPERPLLSMPRFEIVLFPGFWVIATFLQDRARTVFVVATCVIGWAALSIAFMNWRFVF